MEEALTALLGGAIGIAIANLAFWWFYWRRESE